MKNSGLYDVVGSKTTDSSASLLGGNWTKRPFERLTALVRTVLDVPICAISSAEQGRQLNRALQVLDAQSLPGAKFLSPRSCKISTPLVVRDAIMDRRFSDNPCVIGPPFVRSCAAVPLEAGQAGTLGWLCAIDTVPRTFGAAQIGTLQGFAALAVEELGLRELADRDELTGALTRRGFLSDLQDAYALFDRYQRPSALLVLDIDHFKLVNDCFGHAAGDQVLKAVVGCCDAAVRLTDSLGRLGGEEFGVLLLEVGREEAWLAAERIRQAVAELRFYNLMGLKLTASLGVAPLTAKHGDVTAWAERADEALYAAKRGGRDRTAISM